VGQVPALSQPVGLPSGYVPPPAPWAFGTSTAVISPTAPPNVLSLLVALRRRYKLAFGVGAILGGLVAVAVWFFMPSAKYTTSALLQVAAIQPKMLFPTGENRVDFQTYQKTQQQLIKSRIVLSRALKNSKVSKLPVVLGQVDPVQWLEKRIQANFVGEFFQISMSGDKPDGLANLVNAVAEAYLYVAVGNETADRQKRQEQLQGIYNEYQGRLKQKREDLKKLAEIVGSKDPQTNQYTQELAIERLSTARRELIQIQGDLRRAKAELDIRSGQGQRGDVGDVDAVVPESEIQKYIGDDPQVQKLQDRVAQQNGAYAKAHRIARNSSDPSLRASLRELEASRKALAARVAKLRPEALEALSRGGPNGEEMGVRSLRDKVRVLEELGKVTQEIVDGNKAETKVLSENVRYIDDIQDEIANADNAAKRIGEELEALTVELKAPPRIRAIEGGSAVDPRQEEDKRVTMAGMAGLGTCGLFILGVAFLEFRTRRISTIDEVIQWLGLRVMGALPPIHHGRRGSRVVKQPGPYGGNLLTESIDSIRTMILHSTGDGSLRSIMVTSAASGEGKTSLACHLATSLARSGMKTLLIDCDLRKPSIHRIFDIPATPGFSEYLRGEAGADDVIRASTTNGPDMVTAGAYNDLTLRALAQASPGSIFDAFRGSHDIIIVDTSPVLPVTDALLVGRHIDAAVYSILRDVSRLPWTFAALGRLKALDIRVLGAVVTGIRSQTYGTYYSTYGNGGDHE
jgi:capsular exopolysaccharide synthesis family protein